MCGLRSGAARKDAELVPLGIAQNDPRLLSLADIGAGSAKVEEASHLSVPVVGPEVEVQPVLERLRFRDASEQEARQPVRRGPNLELLRVVVDHHPVQGVRPPAAERDGIGGVPR